MKTEVSSFAADAKLNSPARLWSARRIAPGLYETEWQMTSQIQCTQRAEIHAVEKEMKNLKYCNMRTLACVFIKQDVYLTSDGTDTNLILQSYLSFKRYYWYCFKL